MKTDLHQISRQLKNKFTCTLVYIGRPGNDVVVFSEGYSYSRLEGNKHKVAHQNRFSSSL